MQIFGFEVAKNQIIIVSAAVGGIGVCYALYKVINTHKPSRRRSGTGTEDLELPLIAEHEYGNFIQNCALRLTNTSTFLELLPPIFFNYNENFMKYVSSLIVDHFDKYTRVLVIGSGTGALAFKLSKIFEEVKGIEESFSKTIFCYRLQRLEISKWNFPLEGSFKVLENSASLKNAKIKKRQSQENVEFINADAYQMPPTLGKFQVVILPNSLTNLCQPTIVLKKLHRYVIEKGLLIISSDYNWKRFTNKSLGFGDPTVTGSFEYLKLILSQHFDWIEAQQDNMFDVLGESARSCRIRNCHVTAWIRNGVQESFDVDSD